VFYVCIVAGVMLNVVFLAFGICIIFDAVPRNVFVAYRIAYWLSLIGGLIACRPRTFLAVNYNALEYFVVFLSIGPILQCMMSMVANRHSETSSLPTSLFRTEEALNMIQICTQLLIYANAKHYQIPTAKREGNANRIRQLCRDKCCPHVARAVVWYFALSNFVLWVENSFIETRSSVTSWQKYYFENWPVVYNIFNPMSLVFRFNSALLFWKILHIKPQCCQS